MLYNFNNINYPKELIEWIIVDDSKKYNGDLFPMEEIFMGSNEKSYKHKYYLAYIKDSKNLDLNNFQKTEVSKVEWKTYDKALNCSPDLGKKLSL